MSMLNKIIDIFHWCIYGVTRLHWAAAKGQYERAKNLILKGATINSRLSHDGLTPLHQAVISGHDTIVAMLLSMGADKNLQDRSGDSPLHKAAWEHKNYIMNILLSNGGDTDVNIKNAKGHTALHILADSINLLPAKLILEHGADANSKDQKGRTPLHQLANRRTDDFACIYNLDLENPENYDLLFEKRQNSFFDLLMSYNADVNSKDNDGETPLHVAVVRGNKNIMNMLLGHGANIKAVNSHGETVLHYAARSREKVRYITRLLLSEGAHVNATDTEGKTPLHYLVEFGDINNIDIGEILLSSGADINANDNNGKTPLHCAAETGCTGFVEFLLSKGADTNAKTFDGEIPLDRAVAWGHDTIVKILSSSDASTHVPTSAPCKKEPPLDNHVHTAEFGHSDVQDTKQKLEKHGNSIENKTSFSSNEVATQRQHARQADDPMTLLDAFTSLRIRMGFKFHSYPYNVREGGVGNVWAVPASSDTPDPEECEIIDLFELPRPFSIENTCLDGLTMGRLVKLLRPPDALDNVMEAIEGDGTPWSYLSASILAREIAEFGARWHGCIWSTHVILGGDPWVCPHNWEEHKRPSPEQDWHWLDIKPSEWSPSVISNGEAVAVRFYTFSQLIKEAIYCYTDIYKPNTYKFEWDVKVIAEGQKGMVF